MNTAIVPITAPPPPPRTPPLLVGLAANRMGAGKTTAAQYLAERYGYVRVRFADTMKGMVRLMLDRLPLSGQLINRMVDGDLKEQPIPGLPFELTPRHMMQTLGTEWGRNCLHPDIWVYLTIAEAKRWMREGRSVVIDDMRFPNELAAVRDAGGWTVFVDRPGAMPAGAHASEGQIKSGDCEYHLYNRTDLHAFELGIDWLARDLAMMARAA